MAKDKVSDRLAMGEEHDPFAEIDRRIDANYPELTAEEKAIIKEKAREHVLKVKQDRADDARQKLVEKATERAVRDAEKVAGLHGAFVDVTIDLAPIAAYIALDGTFYYHGVTYEVPANVAATIIDISARTWEHENEIHGRPRRADLGRRQTLVQLGPQHQNMAARAIQEMPRV
jgi:hypothetical protein